MRAAGIGALDPVRRAPAGLVVAILVCAVAAAAAPRAGAQGGRPLLSLREGLPGVPGGTVDVDVAFDAGGVAVSSIVFSLDYDERWLSLDPTDDDGDGMPDRAVLHTPRSFAGSVMFDAEDRDGEIDVFVSDLLPPLDTVPDGALLTLTLDVGTPPADVQAHVRFSGEPAPSFGDDQGAAVPGDARDGSVNIPATLVPVFLPFLDRG